METEADLRRLLKRLYREAPASGPDAKKIKFSHVKDDVQQHCPSSSISTQSLSRAISAQFPNTESKHLGKARHVYVFGIDKICDEGTTSTGVAGTADSSSEQITLLQRQIHLLQKRVNELEQQQVSLISTQKLGTQMSQLLHPHHSIFHGPNTIGHFDELSVDAIITELVTHAPDVYELLNILGQTSRHDEEDDLAQLSKLRVMTSATALLKCRSVQVLGVQLLLAFMLIARSTNRQVYIHNIILFISIMHNTIRVHVINSGNCSAKSHGRVCIIHYRLEVLESTHK